MKRHIRRLIARLVPQPPLPANVHRDLVQSLSDALSQRIDALSQQTDALSQRIDSVGGTVDRLGQVAHIDLFVPVGHFYSPLVGAEELAANWPVVAAVDPALVAGVDLGFDEQVALLAKLAPMLDDVPFPDFAPETDGEGDSAGETDGTALRYHFHNDWYAFQDGLFLHLLLRWLEPSRVVEVGSGFSSAVTLDTVDVFLEGKTELTFVEPYPDRLNGLMRAEDAQRVTLLEQFVQDVDVSVFASLQAGDLLVIDSSHVCKVGSDLYHLLFTVLPQLPAGVVIHFHDVFSGFEYPHGWHVEGRSWNEAYLLRAFLMHNSAFEVLLWPSLLQASRPDSLAEFDRWGNGHTPGAIYIRKTA